MEHFRQALDSVRRGDFGAAEAQSREGLKLSPSSPAGYDLLGLALDGQQRSRESEDAYRQAIRLNPSFLPAYNDLGRHLYQQNRVDEAVAAFTKVLSLDPRNFTANYNLALIARERKDYAKARSHLETAAAKVPNDVPTLLALVDVCLKAGAKEPAVEASRRLAALAPSDSRIQFSLGTLFLEAKEYELAAVHLEQARAAEPKNFELLHDLGQVYTHLKKHSQAEQAFLAALAIKSDSAETLYQLAIDYSDWGHADQAIQVLVRAREFAPQRPDILLLLGRECIQEGFWDDAEEVLKQCISIDPDKVEPHLLLGEAYSRARVYDKALPEYEIVRKLDPNNPQSYVSLGRTYHYLHRYPEADAALNKALRIDASDVQAAYYLGLIAEDQDDYKTAERWFGQVLRIDPKHTGALYDMGVVCAHEEDYQRSRDYLERAAASAPTFAQTYYRLSTVYRRLKDTEHANAAFAQFRKYERLNEEKRSYHPSGVIEFLTKVQDLSESERLARYREELLRTLSAMPDDANALQMLAQVELRLGKTQDALDRINRTVGLHPDDEQIVSRAASLLTAAHLYRDAAATLENFLAKRPDASKIRFALAALYEQTRQDAAALAMLDKLPGEAAGTAPVHSLRGRVLIRKGDVVGAEAELARASALDPDNQEYTLQLELYQAMAGHAKDAGKTSERSKRLGMTGAELAYADGLRLLMAGDARQAQSSLQRAADLSYQWQAPWLALAYALDRNGAAAQPRAVLNQAATLFSASPWPFWMQAAVTSDPAALHKAVELAPNDPGAYPALLALARRQGRCEEVDPILQSMAQLGIGSEQDPGVACGKGTVPPALAAAGSPELLYLIEMARVAQ
jgi:tetratricopeptide (TPR) repeat protein